MRNWALGSAPVLLALSMHSATATQTASAPPPAPSPAPRPVPLPAPVPAISIPPGLEDSVAPQSSSPPHAKKAEIPSVVSSTAATGSGDDDRVVCKKKVGCKPHE